MIVKAAWTLIWAETGQLIPALDDGPDGMLFLSEQAAVDEADRQQSLYGDEDSTATAVPLEIKPVSVSVDSVSVP
jgi:hypothetical protein